MIEVKNVTKRYGNRCAVEQLSFQTKPGLIYGFLGPNGAGKSTTMNMITGYLAPSEGQILVDGIDVLKDPEAAKRKIGYLPELPPLYMDMTVWEYLMFVAELKQIPKDLRKKQLDEICEATKIIEVKHRLIKNLSKGFRQRVGLAQAIVGYPEVIILDEPTVGLDPKQIIEIRDFIRTLREKHTIILSSHILSEISAVCDHIMIMSHGKLVASDTAEGLRQRMNCQRRIHLKVKGELDALMEALSSLSQEITYNRLDNKSESSATITLSDEANIKEEIFWSLCNAKLPIYELYEEENSLEDIFLELTGDNDISSNITDSSEKTDNIEEFSDIAEKDLKEQFEQEIPVCQEAEDDSNL